MAKTQITRTPQGWIDNDNPTVFHPNRRTAREARRKSLYYQGKTAHLRSLKGKGGLVSPSTYRASQSLPALPTTAQTVPLLTGLQQRLYDRLTLQQGVTPADAHDIVTNNGYNKAASYGHMRAAGATHEEAEIVIGLDSPVVSLTYGRARAAGYNHTGALQKALREAQDDDDSDD